MSLYSMLKHVATIQRATATNDSAGSQTKTWTTQYSDVRCCIAPFGDRELIALGRKREDGLFRMVFQPMRPDGTEITAVASDRVYWDARYFEIVGLRNLREADKLIEATLVEQR